MRFSLFFTAAFAAAVLATPFPQSRSRGHREAASNEIGVIELKAHGQGSRFNSVDTQVHGQKNRVPSDEDNLSVAGGAEKVIGRRDVLPRNCRKNILPETDTAQYQLTFLSLQYTRAAK